MTGVVKIFLNIRIFRYIIIVLQKHEKRKEENIMNKLFKACLFSLGAGFGIFAEKNRKAYEGECKDPDYLLVLGCGVRTDKPDTMLMMRITAAAELLRKNPDTKAVCCGGIVNGGQTKSEAQVIYEGLAAYGIAESRLIKEDKSTSTYENFVNAKKLIEEDKKTENPVIAFVTTNFHVLRAGYISEKAGLSAKGFAATAPKGFYAPGLLEEFFVFPLTINEIRKGRNQND